MAGLDHLVFNLSFMWLGPNTCRWLYSNYFSGFIPAAWKNMIAMHDLWVSVFINNNLQICGTNYVVVQQLHLVLLYEICVQCLEFCLNAWRKSRKREVVVEAQNLAWVWYYYASDHQLVWILLRSHNWDVQGIHGWIIGFTVYLSLSVSKFSYHNGCTGEFTQTIFQEYFQCGYHHCQIWPTCKSYTLPSTPELN